MSYAKQPADLYTWTCTNRHCFQRQIFSHSNTFFIKHLGEAADLFRYNDNPPIWKNSELMVLI